MNETLFLIFAAVTSQLQLPDGLLSAVCMVESNHNPKAIHYNDGKGHSLGVCQIKYETAKLVGYKGTAEALRGPKTNALYAGKYLRYQLIRYDGDIVKALAAYNAGKFNPTKSGIPRNLKYVKKVFSVWNSSEVIYETPANTN
jgi:soluble lytic murein transglycosylase-like protein